MISINDLLVNFVSLVSKSAKISRILRQERSLFETLVEEKESNEYLDVDYKTFGDVLIQEIVRYNLKKLTKDGGLKLYGEESNEFTNKFGQKIQMNFTDCRENTKKLIYSVLDGHEQLEKELCELIHGDLSDFIEESDKNEIERKFIENNNIEFNQNDLEVWIDPIDGTRQYINGSGISSSTEYDESCSLYKVTVLIGAYIKSTGQPLLGVVSQPFYGRSAHNTEVTWKQKLYWGYQYGNFSVHSNNVTQVIDASLDRNMIGQVCVSSLEYEDIKNRFNDYFQRTKGANPREWQVFYSPGAGYKFLELISGRRQCYLVTEASTYKWDVCGPHAILKSINNQNGGLIDFKSTINQLKSDSSNLPNNSIPSEYGYKLLDNNQIRYTSNQKEACNTNGILGYVNKDLALDLLQIFR